MTMAALTLNWLASLDRKTRSRFRRTALSAVDYGVVALILFGFAGVGAIPLRVPVTLSIASAIVLGIFLLALGSGWSQRLRDPSMTAAQVSAACATNLAGMLMAPQLTHLFIVMLFMPLAYGSLHFSQRTYLRSWAYLALALAAMALYTGPLPAPPMSSVTERVLNWLVVVFAFGRFLGITAEVSGLRQHLKDRNAELQTATEKLGDLASRDELTGLWNRREFMRLLQEEARRAARNQTPFCVAIIDIDNFKHVNDRWGHLVGDAVLHEMGQLLEFSRRATDSLARYGGEEFTLLLQGARLSTATVALERTRNLVAQHDWTKLAPDLQLTVSAGISAWHPGDTLQAVMNRADTALYEAKHAGRNCVRTNAR